MATVEEYAGITKKIIDLEPIVMKWAIKNAIGDEEFLVAFKVAPNKFKVIRRYAGAEEEKVFNAVDDDA